MVGRSEKIIRLILPKVQVYARPFKSGPISGPDLGE
jgi:hypothetical protein